ncbi:MAG TPA: hypothetical protein VMW89_15175 [Desulfatiglandales bacterium]|nr:hypothetical protein [Desulfatiglandales bacterium]
MVDGFERFSSTGDVPQKRTTKKKTEEPEVKERDLTPPDDDNIRERNFAELLEDKKTPRIYKERNEKMELDLSGADLTKQEFRFGDDADTEEAKIHVRFRPGAIPVEEEPDINENDPYYDSKYFEKKLEKSLKCRWPVPVVPHPKDYDGKRKLALKLIKLYDKRASWYGPEYAHTNLDIANQIETSEEFVRLIRNEYRFGTPPTKKQEGPGKGAPGRPRKRKSDTPPHDTPWQRIVKTKRFRIKKS